MIKSFAFVMPWHISERGGGAEVQANYLALELARRKINVFYICQTEKKFKIGTTENYKGVKISWLKSSGRFQWKDQNKYYKKLQEIEPDFVVQRLSSNVNYVLGKYCEEYNKKFIWICTDNLSPFKNLHIQRFRLNYKFKETPFFKYLIFLTNAKIMDIFRNRGMEKISHAFSQNTFQQINLKSEFSLLSSRMISGHPLPKKVIPIDQRFHNRKILWCGNFGKNKRPQLFIELARKFEQSQLEFCMVGGHGNSAYMSRILEKKPANLTITGQISFDKALENFDNSTILVNTSLSEGFSNTYIQAWLRGIPTIAIGADPDNVISNNKVGFNLTSVNEVAKVLKDLLTDFSRYQSYSEGALKFAFENHTIERMTDNFLNEINNNTN